MKKTTLKKEIQKRLPEDIILEDLSRIEEFTEDEFLVILGWIDAFNNHYKRYGKNVEETFYPDCVFVSINPFQLLLLLPSSPIQIFFLFVCQK